MENKKTPFQSYNKTNILTASKEKLLLMLYDGAIRFLKTAIQASEEDNIKQKNEQIGKVMDIVTELRSTLRPDNAPDICENLDGLYAFIQERLLKGSIEKNTQHLKDALGILTTLRGAWDEAIQSLKA